MHEQVRQQAQRRRTFAIISHPDAGKTTLTEKFLLYGGAIHLAGAVKARKASRHAVSDWMEIEKQRGISVTSSVMQFDYQDKRINILDTPGHQDFSEDTYRTLMAADSAVMLLDAAKGVEAQTIKLFEVCRMRKIPIFTFINKMDRAGLDPFDLLDQLEKVLGIHSVPVTWPVGENGDFQGVYHRQEAYIEVYHGGEHGSQKVQSRKGSVHDQDLADYLGAHTHHKLCQDIELLDMAGDGFDIKRVLQGELTPVFFGSAMNNFGIQTFLEKLLEFAPPPSARMSDHGSIDPVKEGFSGFVFKIQANMNPAHRDRIAFMRICSGQFVRGMQAAHWGDGRVLKLSQPQQLMASDRSIAEDAYPGDVIGLFDPGIYRLGDTLCMEGEQFRYGAMPTFAPEHFARASTKDSLKRKQFIKGIHELSEEGAVQLFKQEDIGREEYIFGVVGVLQFEVIEHRLQAEYGVDIGLERLAFQMVRWIIAGDKAILTLPSSAKRALDRKGNPVLLFENPWSAGMAIDHNKGLELAAIMP